jgi:nucleotide-binding universal stress UspA family protein
MYERIMVPLDGSKAAEMALPYAEEIATKFNSEIALVCVAQPSMANCGHLLRAYLRAIQEKVKVELSDWGAKPGTRVSAEIVVGKAAEEISTYAASKNVSLVVMAGRNRPGESPWLFGHIVPKVLRETSRPVLLVRKEATREGLQRKALIKRIMVPLDGSKAGEQIVIHAEEVAKVTGAEVILFRAYKSLMRPISVEFYTMPEEEVRKINKHREEEAKGYLKSIAGRFREKGLTVSEVTVSGNPADVISGYAESNAVDILTMSTHGLSVIKRWIFRRVSDRVLHAGDMPVLFARAPGLEN